MTNLLYLLIPIAAVVAGTAVTLWRRPGERVVSAVQHLAAGVVFAAAAVEILPNVLHGVSPIATFVCGGLGVLVMLGIKSLEGRSKGPLGLLSAVGIDLLVDGLVLGLAFVAGQKAGLLLTLALTLEVVFLGVTVASQLGETVKSRSKIFGITVGLALLMPLGALAASPIALLPSVYITGFLSFGLIALLYLVTEELLVEAHEKPDSPLISAMFFVGFLGLVLIDEVIG